MVHWCKVFSIVSWSVVIGGNQLFLAYHQGGILATSYLLKGNPFLINIVEICAVIFISCFKIEMLMISNREIKHQQEIKFKEWLLPVCHEDYIEDDVVTIVITRA